MSDHIDACDGLRALEAKCPTIKDGDLPPRPDLSALNPAERAAWNRWIIQVSMASGVSGSFGVQTYPEHEKVVRFSLNNGAQTPIAFHMADHETAHNLSRDLNTVLNKYGLTWTLTLPTALRRGLGGLGNL